MPRSASGCKQIDKASGKSSKLEGMLQDVYNILEPEVSAAKKQDEHHNTAIVEDTQSAKATVSEEEHLDRKDLIAQR